MRRLHCATCTCGDVWDRGHIDTTAPFYALVIAIDRLTLSEQRQRFHQTLAVERPTEGETHVRT